MAIDTAIDTITAHPPISEMKNAWRRGTSVYVQIQRHTGMSGPVGLNFRTFKEDGLYMRYTAEARSKLGVSGPVKGVISLDEAELSTIEPRGQVIL